MMFSSDYQYLPPGPDEDSRELSQNLPPTPQKEVEGEDSELKKQEMLVQYLKDTQSFALQVERAIAVINTMLYCKTTSGTEGLLWVVSR
jgi:hypothetical protein